MTDPAAGDQTGNLWEGAGRLPRRPSAPLRSRRGGQLLAEGGRAARDQTAFFNTLAQGYWMFTGTSRCARSTRHPEMFSSESFTPWEPEPVYRFVPTQIDPPQHRSTGSC